MNGPFLKITWSKLKLEERREVSALHKHRVYEILFLVQGRANYCVEGSLYQLTSGDLLITKPNEAHIWINQNDVETALYEQIVVRFNKEAIESEKREDILSMLDGRELGYCNCYPAALFPDAPWYELLTKLWKNQGQEALTALLWEMCRRYPILTQRGQEPIDPVDRITAYIHENLTHSLNVEQLCKRFYISRAHLYRLFRERLGYSVWDYVVEKRLLLAKALIEGGEHPTTVSEKCGFANYSAFYKAYTTHFGTSPQTNKGTGAKTYVDP
ncbi:MAG: helix-turn-helix domain-containing protein [Clostridia bacterium]|nr:helix-turn-helix domain-containing protein [Clostridia bacterium]